MNPLEGLGQPGGIASARLGKVRAAATAAADDRSDLLHDRARVHPADQILGDRGEQQHLVALAAAEHDHARLHALAQLVGEFAQGVRVDALHPSGEHLDAVDGAQALEQVLRRVGGEPGLAVG